MKKRRQSQPADTVTMLDHIKELRLRLFVVVGVLVVGGVLGYVFFEPILQWLISPLASSLYYTTPAGSFNFVMKIIAVTGITVAIPVIIYHVIMFVRPALPAVFSRPRIMGYTGLSVLLALTGAAFAFYVILPGALHFFAGFQVDGLSALIGADAYLSFVTNMLITFVLVFQIPLLLVIIDHIKPLQPKKLLKAEKYVILGGLVISFFVPFALDLTTSLLIATPIVLLYNLSILMVVVRHHMAAKNQAALALAQKEELALDDALIAEFFAEKSEPLRFEPEKPIPASRGLHGVAMEFQRQRQASIADLRHAIERERADAIARKVATYNQSLTLRRVIDVS